MSDIRQLILSIFYSRARADTHHWELTWEDEVLLRQSLVRHEQGNPQGWRDVVKHLSTNSKAQNPFRETLMQEGYLFRSYEFITLSPVFSPDVHQNVLSDIGDLLTVLKWPSRRRYAPLADAAHPTHKNKTEIMYLEAKAGLTGPGRIGRVQLSKTGKTIYYGNSAFQSLKGGYKCNFFEVETGQEYWISRCRKDGQDSLYPAIIQIDEDVREAYWREIRGLPARSRHSSFRSEGKHGRHRK